MPFATFKKVREVSSEDNVHLAENLIKTQLGKKWTTKKAGEKSAYVILEMSDSYKITGIDIGNEHSAFVEVLVGKSACDPSEFKEILITCSFMTPTESKSSNNINRVRCFNRDALVPSVAEDKWSLIKVHIDDNTKNTSITQKNILPEELVIKKTQVTSNLKFREESPDSESENSSSLFSRWKKEKHKDDEQGTAVTRSPIALLSRRLHDDNKTKALSIKKDDNILDRNRENLVFGDETEDTNTKNSEKLERLSKHIEADKKRRRMELEKEINKKPRTSTDSSPKVCNLTTKPSTSKRAHESSDRAPADIKKHKIVSQKKPIESKSAKNFRPFNQLLKNVVLVISGIPNPDRGDLRNKALALGAKYKGDWDDTCTHLICAFKNTPKYNQVKGKGKIVTRSWIEKCYSLKKYLPWRRYALDSKEFSKPESDEEIFDETLNSQIDEDSINTELHNTSLYDIDDRSNRCSSESDTDDEIKRIEQNINAVKRNSSSKISDIYEASTEEEDYIPQKIAQTK